MEYNVRVGPNRSSQNGESFERGPRCILNHSIGTRIIAIRGSPHTSSSRSARSRRVAPCPHPVFKAPCDFSDLNLIYENALTKSRRSSGHGILGPWLEAPTFRSRKGPKHRLQKRGALAPLRKVSVQD